MEESRCSKYDSCTSSSNSSDSATSYYTDETGSSSTSSRSQGRARDVNGLDMLGLFDEEDDSDIEREIRGSTDEITVPLTVCVFIMIR